MPPPQRLIYFLEQPTIRTSIQTDLDEGTIVIRINGTQKPIDVQVRAHDSWTAKAAIEAQYGSSIVSWWRGPTQTQAPNWG